MIKTVYPESYELNYEMVKTAFSGKESLELVIKLPRGADSAMRVKKFNSLLLERTLKLHQVNFCVENVFLMHRMLEFRHYVMVKE